MRHQASYARPGSRDASMDAAAFEASDLPDKPRGLEELSDFVVRARLELGQEKT